MTAILVAAAVGMLVTLLGTPLLIRFLHRRQYGQFIREDGPQGHFIKRGTPTMGGLVIILATVLGYAVANLVELRAPRASGVLLLFLIVGLGLIGFLDDFEKISKERSLGLRAWQKMLGQAFIGITFAATALFFADRNGLTPASTRLSFSRDINLDLAFAGVGVGLVLFVLWANFLITAWSNAVNLTDGLDGLAAGSSAMVFAAYTLIGVWQTNQSCTYGHHDLVATLCYQTRDPRDLAMIAAALMGACFGFLWWNASPAKIFMGDTGSLALGGGHQRRRPDRLLQLHGTTSSAHGAAPPPFRTRRLDRGQRRYPLLDHRRSLRRRRARPVLRRVPRVLTRASRRRNRSMGPHSSVGLVGGTAARHETVHDTSRIPGSRPQ